MHWQNINKELQVCEISPAPDDIHPNLMLYKTMGTTSWESNLRSFED
jgi:hypothetical protein